MFRPPFRLEQSAQCKIQVCFLRRDGGPVGQDCAGCSVDGTCPGIAVGLFCVLRSDRPSVRWSSTWPASSTARTCRATSRSAPSRSSTASCAASRTGPERTQEPRSWDRCPGRAMAATGTCGSETLGRMWGHIPAELGRCLNCPCVASARVLQHAARERAARRARSRCAGDAGSRGCHPAPQGRRLPGPQRGTFEGGSWALSQVRREWWRASDSCPVACCFGLRGAGACAGHSESWVCRREAYSRSLQGSAPGRGGRDARRARVFAGAAVAFACRGTQGVAHCDFAG